MTAHASSLPAHTPRGGKTSMLLLSCLALLTIILAACGGGSTTPGKTSGPSTLNVLASPSGNFTAENFNPFINYNSGSMSGTQGLIYEPLLFVNAYSGDVTPLLASSYQIASDAKSITFTIRQGVKWSDGQPLTAQDVVFTINLMKQYPALDQPGVWTSLLTQSVTSPDANTVKVTFQKPNSTAANYFGQTYIVPQHLWQNVGDPTKYTNTQPVGTGPYTLKTFTPQVYVLQKNSAYWQAGKPQIDQLRFVATNDNTTAQLEISKGEIDWAGVGWDPKYDANFTAKNPQQYHHWFPGTNTVMLYLNLTKAPFNDVRVRQAISLAINRDEIHQKAALYANPANPSAILLPAQQSYLAPEYQNVQTTQDLAKANSLMQQAGYTKDSHGLYAKDGKEISFNMIVPTGWSDWQSSLDVISANLKALGIDAKNDALATPTLYSNDLNTGNYDAAISWTNAGPTPFFALNALLLSSNTWDKGKQATGTNWEHWQDANTDKLLNQYLSSTDQGVQKQAIQGLEKIIAEQFPVIPLDYNVGWFEYTTVHAIGWPDANNPYDYGSPFNAPDNENIVLHLQPAK